MKIKSLCAAAALLVAASATTLAVEPPQAKILDVEFNADGSATDVSPLGTTVLRYGAEKAFTYYNPVYDCYMAHFENELGSYGVESFYRINYDDVPQLYNAIAKSNTLEALVMCDYTTLSPDSEYKPFSSMEGGGIGFLLCTPARGKSGLNEFTFLPYASNTWTWCTSGIRPEARRFYHLVGVYDTEAKTARVYVDGVLCNEVSAPAALKYPAAGCHWFCIGGDPGSNNNGQALWRGDVAMTRIYDHALTPAEVQTLWDNVNAKQQIAASKEFLTNISLPSRYPITRGKEYFVTADGFAQGDCLLIVDPHNNQREVVNATANVTAAGASVPLPADMNQGFYAIYATRGDVTQFLGIVYISFSDTVVKGAEVIAHRGFWNAVPAKTQNSRASLIAALDGNFYGSETDVWITTDGELVINHDGVHNGVTMQTSPWSTVKNLTLSNGENIPRLDDLLDIMQSKPESPTKLIIEIKTHNELARTLAAASRAVEMVKERNMQSRVEYIAFSWDACLHIRQIDPQAKVAYLSGNIVPNTLANNGVHIDYSSSALSGNPTWINQAHDLGLTVNVWTVNSEEQIITFTTQGADFITTDVPDVALKVKNTFDALAEAGIDSVIVDNNNSNSPAQYYNLQGVKVENPSNGIYIVRRGSKATKEYIR